MRDTLAAAASMRTLGEALRAQTHEHGNRMHTAVALLELGRTEEAISLGATHYLVKPFTFAALYERLEQYRLFHRREAGHVASRRATVSRAPGRGRPHRAGCAVRRSGQTGVGVPLAPLRDCARQEPAPPPSRSAKDRPSPR